MIIKQAENGIIVKVKDGTVLFEDADCKNDKFKEFLYYMLETLGPAQNQFSDDVIQITTGPGDEYTPEEANQSG